MISMTLCGLHVSKTVSELRKRPDKVLYKENNDDCWIFVDDIIDVLSIYVSKVLGCDVLMFFFSSFYDLFLCRMISLCFLSNIHLIVKEKL